MTHHCKCPVLVNRHNGIKPAAIYAIFRKDGKDVKSIAQYGKNGQKIWEIHTDEHHGLQPHYHKWEDKASIMPCWSDGCRSPL